ncbi:MAG: GAF domain-containing protein, partial [Rhizobacter sp.]|nr:GAF domain-containing protein [Rhizobacter sp.]
MRAAQALRRSRSAATPVERLLDAGLRLAELLDEDAVAAALVAEARALVGARRVLVASASAEGFVVASAHVPRGQDPRVLLGVVAPVLEQVRKTRGAALCAMPAANGNGARRRCVAVPLVARARLLAVLYADATGAPEDLDDSDCDMLATLAAQAAAPLANAREHESVRKDNEQRNAELAVIGAIQQGISAELDLKAIVDLVGDKVREVFATGNVNIGFWDDKTDLIQVLYRYEHGRPLPIPPPWQLDRNGPLAPIILNREPRVANTRAEQTAAGIGPAPGTDWAHSLVGVPIVGSNRVIGMMGLQNHDREYAYGPDNVRLLQTIAASMGVALENARLFGQTQQLLKETAQRNAELAVINSIQQGIAGSLSFQSIVELVGDKLREVLHVDTIGIRWYDQATHTAHFLYEIERGMRVEMASVTVSRERFHEVVSDRSVVVRNTAAEVAAAGVVHGTDCSLSTMTVKIVAHDRVVGVVVVESFEREYAFGEGEVRLLQTVVTSMGVALENARLFDETQRLLKETEQRNAELGVIHSIQRGMSATLDFRAIVDLVGDKLDEIFGTGTLLVGLLDHDRREIQAAYLLDQGRRQRDVASIPWDKGFAGLLMQTCEPLLLNRDADARGRALGGVALGEPRASSDPDPGSSYLGAPVMVGGKVIGVIGIYARRDDAFTEADLRLSQTLAASMGVALENARLFNETREALEQQTATARVLQVMSRSPADAQPVFEAIVDSALALCDARIGGVARFDGELVHLAVFRSPTAEGLAAMHASFPMKPSRRSILARSILERDVIEIRDVLADPDYELKDATRKVGYRSNLGVPMIRDGHVIGSIGICREEPSVFSEKHIRLLRMFADQAMIAIENVRLFNETKEALDRQTATAEILRVIAGSPDDVQPVFAAIAERARRLLGGLHADVVRRRGDALHLVARTTMSEAAGAALEKIFPEPLTGRGVAGKAILSGEPASIVDVQAANEYSESFREDARMRGFRSLIAVPMMRNGTAIGAINVTRAEPGPFPASQVRLLQTFADQAVIAIENVRLF